MRNQCWPLRFNVVVASWIRGAAYAEPTQSMPATTWPYPQHDEGGDGFSGQASCTPVVMRAYLSSSCWPVRRQHGAALTLLVFPVAGCDNTLCFPCAVDAGMSITTSSNTFETCATGSMRACLRRYCVIQMRSRFGLILYSMAVRAIDTPRFRHRRISSSFITRLVIVYASAIALFGRSPNVSANHFLLLSVQMPECPCEHAASEGSDFYTSAVVMDRTRSKQVY